MNVCRVPFLTVTAAALLAASVASAQSPAGSPQRPDSSSPATQQERPRENQPRLQVSPLQGELMSVDTELRTFVILTDATGAVPGVSTGADSRIEFVYDATTQVEGADRGMAGLSTMKAQRVTVHFIEEEGEKKATRIEVGRAGEAPRPDAPSAPDSRPQPR